MSCPDWSLLTLARDEDEAAWDEALLHFDTCELCRKQAIEAEPTLLFRGMTSPRADLLGTGEIASIKSAVATMRRTQSYQEQRKSSWWSSSSLRVASLAALLLSAGLLEGVGLTSSIGSLPTAEAPSGKVLAWVPAEGEASALAEPASQPFSSIRSLEQIPLVEDVDPAYGSIIQVIDQDLSLLVVVPNSLGV